MKLASTYVNANPLITMISFQVFLEGNVQQFYSSVMIDIPNGNRENKEYYLELYFNKRIHFLP